MTKIYLHQIYLQEKRAIIEMVISFFFSHKEGIVALLSCNSPPFPQTLQIILPRKY